MRAIIKKVYIVWEHNISFTNRGVGGLGGRKSPAKMYFLYRFNAFCGKKMLLSPNPTDFAQPIQIIHPLQSKFLPMALITETLNHVKEYIRYQETQYISQSTCCVPEIHKTDFSCA